MSIAAVITAGGSSSRMQSEGGGKIVKKEYCPLGDGAEDDEGKPLTVLGSAVRSFAASSRIGPIVITVPADTETGEYAARASLPSSFFRNTVQSTVNPWILPCSAAPQCMEKPSQTRPESPRILFVPGGKTRQLSVYHALSLLSAYMPDYVLIHDGARPWIESSLVEAVINAVIKCRAVIPVVPLVETPKEIGPDNVIRRHLKRSCLATAQTPQAFAFPDILYAHEKAAERALGGGIDYTDDAEIWAEFCGPVSVIQGSPRNRKITFKEDMPHYGA
ncbi:MAG: 2-C-methyl-D-erythritol 4-phosphate cytidylyltransferase [Treponema sp.]|jgi:2-C-methyl-D-erythritol 4-phosphate cytidylyltransferase|nr:2-C-methyl-D-erythritol 4-phosphate cytidylyltransferase [Treponema sp.]